MSTKKDIKFQAAVLLERLKHLGVNIKSTQALEAVSALLDSTDWSRLNAKISRLDGPAPLFQPKEHKILVTPPGYGKTQTLMSIFKREVEEGIKMPVYVTFHSASNVTRYWEQTSDIMTRCQVVTIEAGVNEIPMISADAKGVIFVLKFKRNHSRSGDSIFEQFLNRFEAYMGTELSMRIGTLMFDEFHIGWLPRFDSISRESRASSLSRLVERYQGIGSIEQLIISSQLPINDADLVGFRQPIKTLTFGYFYEVPGTCLNRSQEHFDSRPTRDLFVQADRYVEDVFWYTCAVLSVRDDIYREWHAAQNRSYVDFSLQKKQTGLGPVIAWLDAENQRRRSYAQWLKHWAKAHQESQ